MLDSGAEKALLVSRYGLDAKPYHESKEPQTDIPWEKCTLRAWLNGDFLKQAFTEEEQRVILLADIRNVSGKGEAAAVQKETAQDRIFLPGCAEARVLFDLFDEIYGVYANCGSELDVYAPTAYAKETGARDCSELTAESREPAGRWWLRSSVQTGNSEGLCVNPAHGGWEAAKADDWTVAVRPALWLDLQAAGYRTDDCFIEIPEKRENIVHTVEYGGGRKDSGGEGHFFGITMAAERAEGGFVTNDYESEYGDTYGTLCFHTEPYSQFHQIYKPRWNRSADFSVMREFCGVKGYRAEDLNVWSVSAGTRYTAAVEDTLDRLLIWRWDGCGTPVLLLDTRFSTLADCFGLPAGARLVNADAATVPGAIILDYEIPMPPNRKNTFSLKKGALAVPVRRLLLMEEREKAEEDDE